MTSTIIAIILSCLLLIFGVTISIILIIIVRRMERPQHICMGMKIYYDNELEGKLNWAALTKFIIIYVDGMCPNPFDKEKLIQHISTMKCYLRNHRLITTKRNAEREGKEYTGLTHSKNKIEIACDSYFWNEDGLVRFHATAFDTEILNASIEALITDGYYVALAEGFIDPENRNYWGWFKDANADGKQDAEDIKIWKQRRQEINNQMRIVKKRINKELEKML